MFILTAWSYMALPMFRSFSLKNLFEKHQNEIEELVRSIKSISADHKIRLPPTGFFFLCQSSHYNQPP